MPVKLAMFDVDGTLLRDETACQTIARSLGKLDRMSEFEALTEHDEILAARGEMAAWYLDAGRDTVTTALSNIQWAPGAPEGISALQNAGVKVVLASVTWSFAVEHVAETLGIEEFRATALDFSTGRIEHAWGSTKADYLQELSAKTGCALSEVAAVGDTSGDYDMLELAGKAIFVGEQAPEMPDIMHMPGADIRDVAQEIIGNSQSWT